MFVHFLTGRSGCVRGSASHCAFRAPPRFILASSRQPAVSIAPRAYQILPVIPTTDPTSRVAPVTAAPHASAASAAPGPPSLVASQLELTPSLRNGPAVVPETVSPCDEVIPDSTRKSKFIEHSDTVLTWHYSVVWPCLCFSAAGVLDLLYHLSLWLVRFIQWVPGPVIASWLRL